MAHEGPEFLPRLTAAFVELGTRDVLETREFADACVTVLPIFNYLGSVFLIARNEFSSKNNTVTVKNSPGRNLHRLMNSILFISLIFQNLANGQAMKEAVAESYERSLAPMHTWVVRAGIKTGMMALPTREDFLRALGETESSALTHMQAFVKATERVVQEIARLYQGVTMPRSDFTFSWWQ
ncbi:hypothetical protein F751_1259 [Auxenochlorella protothecoides]|uniref:Glycolipid transfer protein domain-containing protein n=1 Tax=Auxenochlorella protothecoides TaxID=3075 RepID=A0A087SE24_AUXPR|nr:hypothetical protein F751_1259 [Auxenochlorella protothecoides]KFM23978.1 hypothetical protein F751_1259 [Auxenochlorella protothecoides]